MKNILLKLIPVSIVLLVAFLYWDLITDGLQLLLHIPILWVLIGIAVYSINWILKGYKWKLFFVQSEKFSILYSTLLVLVGNFSSLILPAKSGDLVRMALANKSDISKTEILGTVITDRIWDFFGIILVSIIATLLFVEQDIIDQQLLMMIFLLTIFTIVLFHLGIPYFRKNYNEKLPETISDYFNRLSLGLTGVNRNNIAQIIFLSITIWSVEGYVLHIFLASLNINIGIAPVIVAVLVGNISKVIPITPGGFVIYEVSIGSVLHLISGLNLEFCISLAILDSFFKNGYTLIFGFPGFYRIL